MTNTMAPTTTVGGAEYVERFTRIAAAAFYRDPLERRVIYEEHNLPAGTEITIDQLYENFLPWIQDSVEKGAEIIEAGSWAGTALWIPPSGASTSSVGASQSDPARPLLNEYIAKRNAARQRQLGDRRFWVLHILARNPDSNIAGAVRAVVHPYLQRAREEAVPVWLEATTRHAVEVYIHFGFRLVETFTISEGTANAAGDLVEGGEGFRVYGLIYEP